MNTTLFQANTLALGRITDPVQPRGMARPSAPPALPPREESEGHGPQYLGAILVCAVIALGDAGILYLSQLL